MPLTKRNPQTAGTVGGDKAKVVVELSCRPNYSKIREAVQPYLDMGYYYDVYKARTNIDDWFAVCGLLCLSKAEYFVLRFIVARTIHYGKTCEIITKAHFLEGIRVGEEWKAAPCGVHNRELYTALARLEETGFIKLVQIINGRKHIATAYNVEVATILSHKGASHVTGKLKIPKKSRISVVSNDTSDPLFEGYQMTPQNSKQYNTNNSDEERCVKRIVRRRQKENEIDCNTVIRNVIDTTKKRTLEKLDEKVRRGRAAPGVISLDALNATWKKCMVRHYGSCTVMGLTHKDYGIFKKMVKPHDIGFAWEDFIGWLVSNWSSINKSHAEYLEYLRRSGKGWDLASRDTVLLTTKVPDISVMVRKLNMLIRRYVDRATVTPIAEDTGVVVKLREELAQTKKRVAVLQHYEDRREMAGRRDDVARKLVVKKVVKIKDYQDFGEIDDEELPEWRDEA